MLTILPDPIEEYLQRHVMERSEVFTEMEAYAREHDFPIVGPLVGQLLSIISRLSNAKDIFEIGSGFGYSALWYAIGLNHDGKIICTEFDETNIKRGEAYAKRLKMHTKIEFVSGDGIVNLEKSGKTFDIIFNDAQKESYPRVFEIARHRLRKNGLLISDNVLWSGDVVSAHGDEETEGIKKYNSMIFTSDEFMSSIIPLRDGISISIKL